MVTPDGRRVVSASDDTMLKVWDLETGHHLATLKGHTDHVRACVVTPDGRRVVSASDDKTLKVWDLQSGHPLATLESDTGSVAAYAVTISGDPTDRPPNKQSSFVVVVDQFEELFTQCKSEAEQAGFVEDLLSLLSEPSASHRLVLTVRSDFESFVARFPALYELYVEGRIAITPPNASELRKAIEAPAERVGLSFEAGVVERLLQELLGEPAGLPLLQFTLRRLWDERTRNRITAESYDRIGGGRQCGIHSIAITETSRSRSPKTVDGDRRKRSIAIGGPTNRSRSRERFAADQRARSGLTPL